MSKKHGGQSPTTSQRGAMLVNLGQQAPKTTPATKSPFTNGAFLANPGQPSKGSDSAGK